MSNYRLTLRSVTSNFPSPFQDVTTNTILSHQQLDNNFITLKGNHIHSGSTNGAELTLNKINGESISIDLSSLTDTYTTGATLSGNTLIFNRTDQANAYQVDLSTLSPDLSGYLPLSGGVLTGAVTGTTLSLSGVLNLANIQSGTSIGNLEFDASGNIISGDSVDYLVTGFTYDNANNFTVSVSDGNDYTATINELTGLTINGDLDVFGEVTITFPTHSGANKVFSIHNDLTEIFGVNDNGYFMVNGGLSVGNQFRIIGSETWSFDEFGNRLLLAGSVHGNVIDIHDLQITAYKPTLFSENYGTPHSSAIVQIDSTSKGFLPPRMFATEIEAISSPEEGLLAYSRSGDGTTVTSKGLWMYNGLAWEKISL